MTNHPTERKWVTADPTGVLPPVVMQWLATPANLLAAIAQSEGYTDAQLAAIRQIIVPIVVSDIAPVGPSVGDLWVDTN